MDKNEVITLSSDEESDFTQRNENSTTSLKSGFKNSAEFLDRCLQKFENIMVKKNKHLIILNRRQGVDVVNLPKVPEKKQKVISRECPEVVDLENFEKSTENEQVPIPCTNNKSPKINEKHSNLDVIDIDEIPNGDDTPSNSEINKPDVTDKDVSKLTVVPDNSQTDTNDGKISEGTDQNLKFFTEFVEYCGCLEEIPNDRARLTKKLMKRYGEADSNYIKSQEFKSTIQKCMDKVNKNNLYLIAKEITDELTYRKKLDFDTGKSNVVSEASQREVQGSTKISKKRTKVIRKILKKLDKLGSKIKELEEEEVNLSDEEESSYVQLQRYRERFCQIYTRLCKYTNEVPDADRIYNRRICFTESKYPAINRCIENWLNKTKRFPDFSDIMKLLESQSDSLGIPSNRESIRVIAIEIFQQVGAMLQRRRKFDLWDSFCGFLDEAEDPASKDSLLDRVLRNNFEIRVKKEQEIFQHFAELQEMERLEPEEVPDDEANHSPPDSGNDDDKEIEDIENSLNRRLDDEIRKETEDNGTALGNSEWDEGKNDGTETQKNGDEIPAKGLKESKNNFKNCKSLKWRLESGAKGKSDSVNSEDSTTETEKEAQKKPETESDVRTEEVESVEVKVASLELSSQIKMEEVTCRVDSPSKRKLDAPEGEDGVPKKRKCDDKENEVDLFEVEDNSETTEKKTSEVFQVHCCQIFASNAFEGLSEKGKDWEKRKVFRDLTNVNQLMGRTRKTSGLFFLPSFFHRGFTEFEKPQRRRNFWKKRFKVSFKVVGVKGQKCALGGDENSGKTVSPDSGGDTKNVENSSEGAGEHEDGDNSHGCQGNGSEGDNNEDENKGNGKTGDEPNENQHEEDDEEEEEKDAEKEDNKASAESPEHSYRTEKTEEQSGGNESLSNREENEEKSVESIPKIEEEQKEGSITENVVETTGEEQKEESITENMVEMTEVVPKEERTSENVVETTEEEQKEESISENVIETTEVEPKEESRTENVVKTTEVEQKEESRREDVVETTEVESKEGSITVNMVETTEVESKEGSITENLVEMTEVEPKEERISENAVETTEVEPKEGSITENMIETTEVEQKEESRRENVVETTEEEQKEESISENAVETTEVEPKEGSRTENMIETTEVEQKEESRTENMIEKTEVEQKEESVTENKEESQIESTSNEVETPNNTADTQNYTELNAESPNDADLKVLTPNDSESLSSRKDAEKPTPRNSLTRRNSGRKSVDAVQTTVVFPPNENARYKPRRKPRETTDNKQTIIRKPVPVDPPGPKPGKRSAASTSDEEIVKRFLLHSPSSISITPPRKLSLSKPPSQAAMQALATLRNLKGISATIVRGSKPKSEDDVVVIGGSYRRRVEQNSNYRGRRRQRTEVPVISNVHSVDSTTPKIVTVQGNVSGFDSSWPDEGNSQCNSSSIRISNVWGSLPNNFMQNSEPGCSSRQNNPGSSNAVRKKNAKKTVEYVVLE